MSRREEDGRKWLRRSKQCAKCCRAVLRRRRRRKKKEKGKEKRGEEELDSVLNESELGYQELQNKIKINKWKCTMTTNNYTVIYCAKDRSTENERDLLDLDP